MARLLLGTVTFMFTDVEGSTRLLQALGFTGDLELLPGKLAAQLAAYAMGAGEAAGDARPAQRSSARTSA